MRPVYAGSGGGLIPLYTMHGGLNLISMAASFWLTTGAKVATDHFLIFNTHGPGAGWFSDFAAIGYLNIEGNGQLQYHRTDGLVFQAYPVLVQSADVIRPFSTHLIEVIVVPYTRSGTGFVALRLDGVEVGVAGPVPTSNTVSGQVGIATLQITAPTGGSVGPVLVMEGEPDAATLADMQASGAALTAELVPVSDAHREWKPKTDPTQSWPDVDETIQATDGDATAVEAWGGRIDQLAVGGAGGGIVVPLYAQPQVRARALGSSPYTRLAVGSRKGGVEMPGAYAEALSTSYASYYGAALDADPATGLAWADMDAVRALAIQYQTDDYGISRLTQVGPDSMTLDAPGLRLPYVPLVPDDMQLEAPGMQPG